ncbi:MAG: hypothetical protein ACP5H2_07830 [Solirubrobacteraceae bacterium]
MATAPRRVNPRRPVDDRRVARHHAAMRRDDALVRVRNVRRAIFGGVATSTVGLAVFIQAVDPAHGAKSHLARSGSSGGVSSTAPSNASSSAAISSPAKAKSSPDASGTNSSAATSLGSGGGSSTGAANLSGGSGSGAASAGLSAGSGVSAASSSAPVVVSGGS